MFITYRRTGGIFALLTFTAVAFAATVLTVVVAATVLIVALGIAATVSLRVPCCLRRGGITPSHRRHRGPMTPSRRRWCIPTVPPTNATAFAWTATKDEDRMTLLAWMAKRTATPNLSARTVVCERLS
jgi:hypothetical protein